MAREPVASKETDRLDRSTPVVSNPKEKKTKSRGEPATPASAEGPVRSVHAGAAGAQSAARADYLRNPPPPYPAEAKRSKQQGVVLLRVVVGATGRAESLVLLKSSGYSLLDASAIEAVKKWKFHPAMVAGVKISSAVNVPVRFRLD